MARTQRRRAARALRQADGASARASACSRRAAVAALLSRDEWDRIVETLEGLLSIEIPTPFTDLEHLCPKQAWLILNLTSVRPIAGEVSSLRHQMTRVLDALTRLLVHAETLRSWRDLFESFWRRILTSEMLVCANDAAAMRSFIKFVQAKGAHVAFLWRGRCIDSNQVLEPLAKCLETRTSTPNAPYIPVQVSLRFEDCQLARKSLKGIHRLLQIPAAADDKQFLFVPSTIRELSFSSNILHTHDLYAIATIIADPTIRRIDGLKLDSTVPDKDHQTQAYAAAFSRVLAAVVNHTTPSEGVSSDPGVALSLEDSSIFFAYHVDVLANTLARATRPLRALSLACWRLVEEPPLNRFARFLLTAIPTATHDFDLNVSCIRGPGRYVDDVEFSLKSARSMIIDDAIPRLIAASARGQRLACRLLYFAFVTYEADSDHAVESDRLSEIDNYEIREVRDDGQIQIVLPPYKDYKERTGWTHVGFTANIRIGDDFVLLCGPFGLIIDNCSRSCPFDDSRVPLVLLEAMGAKLSRLSMRENGWCSEQYVSWCPELQEFNGEGYCKNFMFWTGESPVAGEELQVINVSKWGHEDPIAIVRFLAFPKLRSLSFAYNNIAMSGLDVVYEKLATSRQLEYVDLRHVGLDLSKTEHELIYNKTQVLLAYERISDDASSTFQWVLRRLETTSDWYFSSDVVDLMLAFAGSGRRRVVEW